MIATRSIVLFCCAWLAANIAGCGPQRIRVDASEARIYGEDASAHILAARYKSLDAIAKQIEAKEYQEVFGVRQSVRRSGQVAVSPTGATLPAAASPGDALTLPDAPTYANADFGRSYADILRDRVTRDHHLLGYELKYLGDWRFFDRGWRVYLVGVDLSVEGSDKPSSKPEFAQTTFRLIAGNGDDDIRIYAVMPEFSAVTALESLVSQQIEDYLARGVGAVQGFDITGQGRLERMIETTFGSAVDQPLSYVLYHADGSFSIGLGPRRRIRRRCALDPRRWIGDTYAIEYEMQPGPRAVQFIVLVGADVERATLLGIAAEESVSDDPFGKADNARSAFGAMKYKDCSGDNSPIAIDAESSRESVQSRSKIKLCLDFPPPSQRPSQPPTVDAEIDYLTPGLANALTIQTYDPISPLTEVFLGPIRVPTESVTVIGRYRLRIDLGSNAYLSEVAAQAALGKASNHDLTLRVVSPEHSIARLPVDLSLLRPVKVQETELVLSKDAAPESNAVVLQVNSPVLTAADILEVRFGKQRADIAGRSNDKVFLTVPNLGEADLDVLVYVTIKGQPAPIVLPKTFQFKGPPKKT